MTDRIRVTVAPGRSVHVTPHPSGIAGLPPLVLRSGNTLDVTREHARALLASGLILDPATGRPPPPAVAARINIPTGPSFSADGDNTWVDDARMLPPMPPPDPDQVFQREPIVAGQWDPRTSREMVRKWDDASGDPITDAQGRPWPQF